MEILQPSHTELPEDIRLAFSNIEEEHSLDGLPELEKEELQQFSNKERKREFLATRVMIRDLGKMEGIAPADFIITKNEMGRPYGTANKKHVYLSIAHSHKFMLCGLSLEREIGADLEPVGRKVNSRLKERILHEREAEQLGEIDTVRLWTIKEALVKLKGRGLRTNLNEVKVSPLSGNNFLGIFDNDKSAIICNFKHRQYWLSVAYYR